MQPQMVTALLSAYQGEAMPLSVLFDNLQRGELIPPTMEFEEYEAQLDDSGPSFDQSTPDEPEDDRPDDGLLNSIRARLGL
jgi:hypothetical protein